MALPQQTSPMTAELLALGVVRVDAVRGELIGPNGQKIDIASTNLPMAGPVPDAAEPTVSKAEFDLLLTRLRQAGYLAT